MLFEKKIDLELINTRDKTKICTKVCGGVLLDVTLWRLKGTFTHMVTCNFNLYKSFITSFNIHLKLSF